MPSILNLKFKGNKSFVAFSNLGDTESLTKTWKVCTKVASYLEQGQRLENLSWRLWHLQNLMVDTDNARSKREFRKLSKCMGDKLDKEKGRNIAELEAPDFRRNHSTDMIQQRAVEKERNREASLNTKPGLIKRMQFTFSVDQPTPAANSDPVKKPDLKPSPEFTKRSRQSQRAHAAAAHDSMVTDDGGTNKDPPSQPTNEATTTVPSQPSPSYPTLRFPSIFSNDFGPAALLGSAPTLSASMNYGEGVSSLSNEFSIVRPTIELPLDELMTNVDSAESPGDWTMSYQHNLNIDYNKSSPESNHDSPDFSCYTNQQYQQPDNVIQNVSVSAPVPMKVSHSSTTSGNDSDNEESSESDEEDSEYEAKPTVVQQVAARASGTTPRRSRQLPARTRAGRSNTPRPTLSVRTQNTRSSGPSATATTALSTTTRSNTNTTQTNSAPGGVKAECHNCGATHTPLWRRGLNDELNCNACGLYCKLHKRPRPKTMRSSHGGGGGGGGGGTTTEGRAQAAPRQEIPDVMAAQCYNCHTTATPLWRKDDEGKTVCNACGLYYKLHGSARPISMKSDVIRKRSRHDARRVGGGNNATDTPSASPGVSRRPSPSRESSPTFAPDSTTQMSYDYDLNEFRSTQSELMGALGSDGGNYASQSLYHQLQFPGPYHPDLITAYYPTPADALPFASISSIDSSSDLENSLMSPRSNKRRRMSNDSASEPPSSAVSYSSYNSGYSTSASSASHSQRSSIDFPFSNYPLSGFNGPALRASSNAFWHPPMMPQPTNTSSPQVIHPPMLPPTNTEDSPMDFLHHPHDDDTLFSTYIHPPMSIPEGENSSGGGGGSLHPPMFPNDFSMGDPFENSIRGF